MVTIYLCLSIISFFKEKKLTNLPLKQIFNINHETILRKPDLIIYLDIDPLIGKTRKKKQKNHQRDLIERQSLTYFQTVRQGYYHYLTHYVSGLKLILDGSDPIQSNIQKIMKYLGEI
ncbi:hypothetical protein ['Camptotheca acuminata' phytoplasma]|uniref:hypothetical protein n=1 Tax='Camptotheca acuminata' phytoplasma TaxID=3239192 RepID=UPI003519D812